MGARIADLDRKKYLVPGDLTGEENCNPPPPLTKRTTMDSESI